MKMTLAEIAEKIGKILTKFMGDAEINRPSPVSHTRPYYFPMAFRYGAKVAVRYVHYQCQIDLTREEALKYLAWLEAGNVGTHWDMEKAKP